VRRRVVAIALVAVLGIAAAIGGLAGCAGASSGGSPSSGTTGAGDSAGLPTVTGDFGGKPAVTVPKGDPPSSLRTAVLHQGTGPAVTKGQLVAVDYLGLIWKSGKVFDTSFQDGHSPAAFTVGTGQVIDGFDQGLLGQKVGSRVLLVIPPAQGYGSQGNSAAGITGTDTIVFVVDLLGAHDGDESADGSKAAPLSATLPAVSTGKGRPTVTIPKGTAAPTKLVTATVLQGSGDVVRSGDLVIVQYVGVKWADGKTFDSSWDRGAPSGFPIGLGQVIPGWDKGLVGRHISGTDTLVFAVDIVGTYH